MTRVLGAIALGILIAGTLRAQENPRPEPVALKKQEPSSADAKKATKSDPNSRDVLDEAKQLAERIVQAAKDAGKRLAEQDPGTQTQRKQKVVVAGIDELIKRTQNPPPQDQSNSPPDQSNPSQNRPMTNSGQGGGGTGQQRPGSAQQPGAGRRERKSRREQSSLGPNPASGNSDSGGGPMPRAENNNIPGRQPQGGAPASARSKESAAKVADLYKDVWGHLPERLRQELDLYYREQFMPRYQELLRQYYSSLAERKRPGDND
jgi:hypothetical protein